MVKDKYREHVASKAQKIVEEIIEEEKEKVFKKVALFINDYTDIGNSNVAMNIKETLSRWNNLNRLTDIKRTNKSLAFFPDPLKSVFKQKDMAFLLSLTDIGQFEYLKILAKVVAGIRLHQYYYKRGSENVDNGETTNVASPNLRNPAGLTCCSAAAPDHHQSVHPK